VKSPCGAFYLRLHRRLGYRKKHGVKIIGTFLFVFAPVAALLNINAAGGEKSSRYEQPTLLTGTIFDSTNANRRVLYKFKRTVTRSGDTVKAVREYTYPDGKLASRELAIYDGDNLMSYELEELQNNARGDAKLSHPSNGAPTISFRYVPDLKTPDKVKADSEELQPDTLVNDMIAPFLAAHWTQISKGETIRCRYIAASRAETVGFKFAKVSESTREGKPVITVKMSASSFIIAALVDPLYFIMEKDGSHRVLQYDGRTTPKLKDGTNWKDLDAVTIFDWPVEAPNQQVSPKKD